jgi:hypothetical protein
MPRSSIDSCFCRPPGDGPRVECGFGPDAQQLVLAVLEEQSVTQPAKKHQPRSYGGHIYNNYRGQR